MKKIVLILLVLALTMLACGTSSTTSIPTIAATQTHRPSVTPQATKTLIPTLTKVPTSPPTPTSTPPSPIILTGSGDSVIDFVKWDMPGVLHATYSGGSNFAIVSYDSQGNYLDLLVNTIGTYDGVVPLDFMDDENPTRLEITASGPFQLEIIPMTGLTVYNVPTTVTGSGSTVFLLNGRPDKLIVDASQAESNFIVYGFSDRRHLLVNEIAPYTGTVLADSDIAIISVDAEGPWSIEITSR